MPAPPSRADRAAGFHPLHLPHAGRRRDVADRSCAGLPDTAFARVVREDPVRKGLLFCGTESGVYVSFDAGDHWQTPPAQPAGLVDA